MSPSRSAIAVVPLLLAVALTQSHATGRSGAVRPAPSRVTTAPRTPVVPLSVLTPPLGAINAPVPSAIGPGLGQNVRPSGAGGSTPLLTPLPQTERFSPGENRGAALQGSAPLDKTKTTPSGRVSREIIERSRVSGRSRGLYGHLTDTLRGEGSRSPEARYLTPSREALASPGSAKDWGERSFQVLAGGEAAALTAAPEAPVRARRSGLLPFRNKTLGTFAAAAAALAAFPAAAQAGEGGGVLQTAGGWLEGAWDWVSGFYGSISWEYMILLMVASVVLRIVLKKVRRSFKEWRQEARARAAAAYRPSVTLWGTEAAQRLADEIAQGRRPAVKVFDFETNSFRPYELSAALLAQVQAGVYNLVTGTSPGDAEFFLVRTGLQAPAPAGEPSPGEAEAGPGGAEPSPSVPEPSGEPVEDSFSPLDPPHGR